MSATDGEVTALSSSALEAKLRFLRDQSNKHSQALTQKLATSQSGQNLLHIGSSLSSLPPDLHSLLTQLHPILSVAEAKEKQHLHHLRKLVECANEIRIEQRRVEHALECAQLYQDLVAAERDVKRDASLRRVAKGMPSALVDQNSAEQRMDDLDHVLSLERAALTTLCLVQDLQRSTAQASALTSTKLGGTSNSSSEGLASLRTPLEDDTERAQFLMKLSPRIRRLESDTVISLTSRLEQALKQLQQRREGHNVAEDEKVDADREAKSRQDEDLLMIGHCMRGLALLGKGSEAESVFARVAIMPLIRSKVSMGRLDEGGSRGECAGLFSLLDDMACSISSNFGPVLRLSESMFDMGTCKTEVDLVTAGVWVPIATALMADTAIKMAIFSPGIASILQANYTALDTFLSELATRLLKDGEDEAAAVEGVDQLASLYFRPTITSETIQRAQDRIYSHSMTAEFSKKWNLPIYYQLRFGDCCSRLNKAIAGTQKEGWIADVFTGSQSDFESLRKEKGLDLPLFLELYDILLGLWRPDVILRPLTHRFLRGAVQLIGRVVTFAEDGLDGKLKFGEENRPESEDENGNHANGNKPSHHVRDPYCWGQNLTDVAAVAWEMTVLESRMTHEYVDVICNAVESTDDAESDRTELRSSVNDVLVEASQQIGPIVQKCWNEIVVNILTSKCCGPLAAVKGVAATYRMTNRPPPTQASPFVGTILRPLKEFDIEFKHRTPLAVGRRWKQMVVSTVASRYSVAVEELIATVQRTEEALKNRKARRTSAGGMSDGEKVKLQLFLDYKEFSQHVQEVGVTVSSVDGVVKLKGLTIEGESLYQQSQNGS